MLQITQVGRLMVPVSDQDAAIPFYRDRVAMARCRCWSSFVTTTVTS